MNEVREVLEFAKARKKPIMIGESTPFGGMNVTKSSIARKYIKDGMNSDDIWNLWYQKTIDLIDEYDISMWSYINCDWGSQPMWRNIGFGDTRLSSSDVVMNHWWDQVLSNNSRFLLRIESCDDQSSSGSNQDNRVEKFIPLQKGHVKLAGSGTATDFQNDWGMNTLTLSNRSPFFVCTSVVVLFVLLGARTFFRLRVRNRVKSSTSTSFDLPNSNGCSEYGSIDN